MQTPNPYTRVKICAIAQGKTKLLLFFFICSNKISNLPLKQWKQHLNEERFIYKKMYCNKFFLGGSIGGEYRSDHCPFDILRNACDRHLEQEVHCHSLAVELQSQLTGGITETPLGQNTNLSFNSNFKYSRIE